MKRLDKRTERKLMWLFLPAIVLMVVLIASMLMNVSIGYQTWGRPALIASLLLVYVGYGIACVRQKCWGMLGLITFVVALTILNMSNFFVDQFYPAN